MIFQARNNIFLFGKNFLIAITPLYQKQLKSQFRGNLDEDPQVAHRSVTVLDDDGLLVNFSLVHDVHSSTVHCVDPFEGVLGMPWLISSEWHSRSRDWTRRGCARPVSGTAGLGAGPGGGCARPGLFLVTGTAGLGTGPGGAVLDLTYVQWVAKQV